MLFLPLPLLLKAQLSLKRKLVLSSIFSLGVFVILAAVLNRYYNFTAGYGSLIYLNWYAGETSTAVIFANVPHLWPLLSRLFRLGAFKSSHGPESASRLKISTAVQSRRRPTHLDTEGYLRSESEERNANKGAGSWTTNSQSLNNDLELGNVDGNAYSATAAGGKDDKEAHSDMWGATRNQRDKQNIVRTVHNRQYSS